MAVDLAVIGWASASKTAVRADLSAL